MNNIKIPEQCFLGTSKPTKKKFDKIQNRETHISKPFGGLWTTDHRGNGECDWKDWNEENDFDLEKYNSAWAVTIKDDVRVLSVDSKEDYNEMIKKYVVYENKAYEDYVNIIAEISEKLLLDYSALAKYKKTVKDMMTSTIDFEELSKDYDVIRLTDKGLRNTSDILSGIIGMYGWDVQSCLILNWDCILNVEKCNERQT